MVESREIHLVRRPHGMPVADDFAVVPVETADAREGEVQLQTLLLSVGGIL